MRDWTRVSVRHDLKTWPEAYWALVRGQKTHEYRRNDRAFRVGDRLYLREWDPESEEYTGNEAIRRITYVTRCGDWGGDDGFVVLSLAALSSQDQQPVVSLDEMGETLCDSWHAETPSISEAMSMSPKDYFDRASSRFLRHMERLYNARLPTPDQP